MDEGQRYVARLTEALAGIRGNRARDWESG